jgi:hypothetical protein
MPKRIISPGQLRLFELSPDCEALSQRPRSVGARRRRFYRGIQLPLPIPGAEPMAIGFRPSAELLDMATTQRETPTPEPGRQRGNEG